MTFQVCLTSEFMIDKCFDVHNLVQTLMQKTSNSILDIAAVTLAYVEQTDPDVVRIVFQMNVDSWAEAQEIGDDVIARVLHDADVILNDSDSPIVLRDEQCSLKNYGTLLTFA